jgi:hypothetical protein
MGARYQMKLKNMIIVIQSSSVPDHPDMMKNKCTILRRITDKEADSLLDSHKNDRNKSVHTSYLEGDEKFKIEFEGFGQD